MATEPVVKMGWFGMLASPALAAALIVGSIAVSGSATAATADAAGEFSEGALVAGIPALIFPIILGIVGGARVSLFAAAVFAASTLHLLFAGGMGIAGWPAMKAAFSEGGGAPLSDPYKVGLIGTALACLTTETLAAVATLRPTWELADSSGSPDSGPWKSPPNGPTTVPSDGDRSETTPDA